MNKQIEKNKTKTNNRQTCFIAAKFNIIDLTQLNNKIQISLSNNKILD